MKDEFLKDRSLVKLLITSTTFNTLLYYTKMLPVLNLYVIVAITAVIWLYLHITRNFKYWKNRNVPYINPVPLFGNIFDICMIRKSLAQFLGNLYKSSNSPYFGFFVFDQPFLLIRDPEIIKQILIKNFDYFNDRSIIDNKRDDEMGASVLFILKNPAWKTIRTKLSPVFATGKMKNMIPLIIEATDDFTNHLSTVALNEKWTDAREICMKFTTDVISSCAFGINAHCFQHEKAAFRETSRRIFDFNTNRKIQQASYFFAPMLVKLFRMKFFDPQAAAFMRDVFWNTMLEREKSNAYRGDLIDVLVQIKTQNAENNSLLDGDMLVAQAAQFFVAGFETTGSTISYTLYELSLDTSIQDRLRKEIRTVLKNHGGITYEAIQEMLYLDMVVNETLRKYPVLAFLDRRCNQTHKIPGTDLIIEKGIPIYISLLGLHFDPEYFPDPEKYDPERFTFENKSTRPTTSYMPFGDGPRNCIGARFGLWTSKVGLIRVLMEFEVELSENTPVPLKLDPNGVLLSPENPLNLHFKRALPE